MFIQIILGSLVISVTLVLQVVFIATAIKTLSAKGKWLSLPSYTTKMAVSLVALVLWLLAGMSLSAWVWAGIFLLSGALSELEPAVYFSVVTFTTLGYGDITLDASWRILASFCAVNGLVVFGLNTAFIAEFIGRLRRAQETDYSERHNSNKLNQNNESV